MKALPRRILNETTTEIISIKPRIITPKYTATSKNILPKDMDDLIHLQGPLTEDAVMRILHARFEDGKYFVSKKTFFFLKYKKKTLLSFSFFISD